jgi:bacterioferritin-associated ferredoxin
MTFAMGPLDLITDFIMMWRRGSGMYVCVCRAVTDEKIKAAIEGGARSVDEVTAACCAGDDCGACHQTIETMIEDHHGSVAPSRRLRVVRAA